MLPSFRLKVSESAVAISELFSSRLPFETKAAESTSSDSDASVDFLFRLFLLKEPSRTTLADLSQAFLPPSLHDIVKVRDLRVSNLDELLDL